MKRPHDERCYLGIVDNEARYKQHKILQKTKRRRHFISLTRGVFYVSYTELHHIDNQLCIIETKYVGTFNDALKISKQCVARGSVPLDRGETYWNVSVAKERVRHAIDAWVFCARRLGVCKDVRHLIAKMMKSMQHLWIL